VAGDERQVTGNARAREHVILIGELTVANIGIIGLGMMGRTHYEAYQEVSGARVVAVADADPKRAAGDLAGTGGNVLRGGVGQLPMDRITGTTDWRALVDNPDVQVVDVCVPTTQHVELVTYALRAGKHVLCEKPLARTAADARKIAAAAAEAKGFFMPAMVMRFWPQWAWLKRAIEEQRYGRVLSATFRRVSSMPAGWYRDGGMSGGAALDLHIHDTDFVLHAFGRPRGVFSRGYTKTSGEADHLTTHYLFDHVPHVVAEGGWCLADGFGFSMRYTVNFERATADFDMGRADPLLLATGGKSEPVACEAGHGYVAEIRYFHDCVERGTRPTTVTVDDGVQTVEVVEAEVESMRTGGVVNL
jgi:predicted dehydrogenase